MKKTVFLLTLITVIVGCAKESDSSKSGNGGSSSGSSVQVNGDWRYIDGLYFDANGNVQSPLKSSLGKSSGTTTYKYIYDNQGRVVEWHTTQTYDESTASTGWSSCYYYEYQGKEVKVKSVVEYTDGRKMEDEYVMEYY